MSRGVVVVIAVSVGGCGLLAGIKQLDVEDVAVPDASTEADEPLDASIAVVPDPPLEAGCVAVGPRAPQTVSVTGYGNDWTTPEAAKNQDGLATIAYGCCSGNDTRLLTVTGFGFAVPPNATIQGVKVLLRARGGAAGTFTDRVVQLSRDADASVLGNNLFSSVAYGTDWELRQYGSASTLWGATLTPDIVNAPDFGVRYQSTKGYAILQPDLDEWIDAVSMAVYYCTRP